MIVADFVTYSGAELVKNRPTNFKPDAVAKVKTWLVAGLLRRNSHDTEVFLQGGIDKGSGI
jgi:hypothetical protein